MDDLGVAPFFDQQDIGRSTLNGFKGSVPVETMRF